MVLLAVDWSGVSLRWTPKQTHFSTVSGRRLVQGLCLPTFIMDLLTRQQAQHHWFEADSRAKFDDLLQALGLYKDISTEYGLNQSVHQQWRFGDPHKKSGDPDRHDYEIKVEDGVEVAPGPVWHSLYRWIISQADEFLAFQTVYLITDNRDLLAATVSSTAGLSHWPMVAAWWKERIQYVGPYGERTTWYLCLYRQTLVCLKCIQRGQEPISLMRVFFFSQTSTLLSSIVTVCLSHYSKFKSCGCHVLSLTPQKMKADSRQQSRAVRLLLHRREQDQLTRDKPRNSNLAPLSSCLNHGA